ncbi:hypothetical protein B0H16DRAFT_287107 [Mycena metata]|uniref:Uncharacterized protein n=1 Tax=Mycena metata TaxID=1033252 RepID=A0AAD7MP58_9AGAR|nr:hypothetical protein B0H16DRAFT_287107 [Mycena metata]
MTYSITVKWQEDKLYHFLDGLRAAFGCSSHATPIHISIVSFLRVSSDGLAPLTEYLRQLCRKVSAHDLSFGEITLEPFGDTCVAVPVTVCRELEEIWDGIHSYCVDWDMKRARPTFEPHATIWMGKEDNMIWGIHDCVRVSVRDWMARHGSMKARAVGLDLWLHSDGNRELVANFPLHTACVCRICDRTRRLEVHGCSCGICVRSMAAEVC